MTERPNVNNSGEHRGALHINLLISKKAPRRVAFELDLGGRVKYHERGKGGRSLQAEVSEQRCRGGKVMAAPMNQGAWEGKVLLPNEYPKE